MASAALRHPVRVRLLEALSLHPEVSATLFINEGWGRGLDALKGKSPALQVSDVSYHLRALERANCVTLTKEVPRRGASEKFFKAEAVAYFSDEEWAELPPHQRREISRVVAQSLIVQIEGAILADTFDSRLDRWLLWQPMKLDEVGWAAMSEAILDFYGRVEQIEQDSTERLEAEPGDGTGRAEPIWATFGVELFESPRLPEFPRAAPDPDGTPKDDAPDDGR